MRRIGQEFPQPWLLLLWLGTAGVWLGFNFGCVDGDEDWHSNPHFEIVNSCIPRSRGNGMCNLAHSTNQPRQNPLTESCFVQPHPGLEPKANPLGHGLLAFLHPACSTRGAHAIVIVETFLRSRARGARRRGWDRPPPRRWSTF